MERKKKYQNFLPAFGPNCLGKFEEKEEGIRNLTRYVTLQPLQKKKDNDIKTKDKSIKVKKRGENKQARSKRTSFPNGKKEIG